MFELNHTNDEIIVKNPKSALIMGWVLIVLCSAITAVFVYFKEIEFVVLFGLCALSSICILVDYHMYYIKVDSNIITKRNFFGKIKEYDANRITKVTHVANVIAIDFDDGDILKLDIMHENWEALYQYALEYEKANRKNTAAKDNQLSRCTVKEPKWQIIAGVLVLLLGVTLLVITENAEDLLTAICNVLIGLLLILSYVNTEITLDEDTIMHKNLFGIKRYLKLSDLTGCTIWDRTCRASFLYQYDERGISKVCKNELVFSTDSENAKELGNYLERCSINIIRNTIESEI